MSRMLSSEMGRELGFLGNVDEGLTIDYVKTEIVDKAAQGDSTAIFKLSQIARHSKQEDVVAYATAQLARLDAEEEASRGVEEVEEVEDDSEKGPEVSA